MPEMQQPAAQQPAAQAPASAANAAVNAQLDAALEIEAKKAALQAMKQQTAGGPAPAGDNAGSEMPITITVNRGGETIELVNPTREQLNTALGVPVPEVPPQFLIPLTAIIVWGAVTAFGLWLWLRRKTRGDSGAGLDGRDLTARMQRIESAIESVAVEVERVSENQRFASRLLSEGAAKPIVPQPQANVPVGHAAGDHPIR